MTRDLVFGPVIPDSCRAALVASKSKSCTTRYELWEDVILIEIDAKDVCTEQRGAKIC